MSLLLENIRWTTRLGSEYRDDPAGVEERFATLEPEIETRQRQDETAWAEELADPASAVELERAARAFAKEFALEPEASERAHGERSDDPYSAEYAAQVTVEDGGRRSRTTHEYVGRLERARCRPWKSSRRHDTAAGWPDRPESSALKLR